MKKKSCKEEKKKLQEIKTSQGGSNLGCVRCFIPLYSLLLLSNIYFYPYLKARKRGNI